MKYTTERKPGSLVELTFNADEQEFNTAVDKAIRKQASRVQIPGFRKGKAPASMVERFYGGRDAFNQDAADSLMDGFYKEALDKEDLRPVGDPELTSIEFAPTLSFVISLPVYPEFELGDYASVRVDPIDAAVSDDDVQEVLDRLQRQQAAWKDVTDRTPREGDQVTIDYTVTENGEPFQEPVTGAVWVLGETNLLQPLRERIEDMQVGSTEDFELVFEEDDETADPQVRGKQLAYHVTLTGLKERDLQPLDDDFAKTVAGAESVDALRSQIRTDIHQGKTSDGRNEVLNGIVAQIADRTEIDLPTAMVDDEIEHQINHQKEELERQGLNWDQFIRMSGLSEEQIREQTRPEAERRLKNSLVLQAIGKQENIEVTDEDVESEIDRMLGANPVEGTDDAANEQRERMRTIYNSDYFKQMLQSELFERKLTDRIIDIATEGRGAVLNAWEPEEAQDTSSTEPTASAAPESGEAEAPEAATSDTEADDLAASTADAETADEDSAASGTDAAGSDTAPAQGGANGGQPSRSKNLPNEGEGTDWVPGDGTHDVPEGFPFKGNASSKIYHPTTSPSYANTIAEIYFATPEAAERFGYRLPKTMQQVAESAGEPFGEATEDRQDFDK